MFSLVLDRPTEDAPCGGNPLRAGFSGSICSQCSPHDAVRTRGCSGSSLPRDGAHHLVVRYRGTVHYLSELGRGIGVAFVTCGAEGQSFMSSTGTTACPSVPATVSARNQSELPHMSWRHTSYPRVVVWQIPCPQSALWWHYQPTVGLSTMYPPVFTLCTRFRLVLVVFLAIL